MKNKLIFASSNQHKVEEIKVLLGNDFEILSMMDIGILEEIEETGNTFEANAAIKAQFIYNKTKLNCFADDSGLEVESLQNEPGIFSARYAGAQRNSTDNLLLVLEKLGNNINRKARFVCVICLIDDGKELFFEGEIKGDLLNEPLGGNGFGYDPIFVPQGYSESFASLSDGIKNQISHRARATAKMMDYLNNKQKLVLTD